MPITKFLYSLCSRETELNSNRAILNKSENHKSKDSHKINVLDINNVSNTYKKYNYVIITPNNTHYYKNVELKTKLVDYSDKDNIRTLAVNKDYRSVGQIAKYETSLICKNSKIKESSKLGVISQLFIDGKQEYSTSYAIRNDGFDGAIILYLNKVVQGNKHH
ncbi:hypothetical protein [Providencia sneebia]|uniref:Uncharacterized protein n=1 Tax=Providencia sneebia DSM 19967 TaxID=1141660 RepID=K8W112_9GAMM|nr:hypothetical protein [Providencia sneebia]EKT53491.1 hypothetical protein OO7_14794 [Providencia sneebia DSM 19967]